MRVPFVLACGVALAAAQMPHFTNARVETRASVSNLADTLQQAERTEGPQWLGYSVARVANGERDGCGISYLENTSERFESGDAAGPAGVVKLEAPRSVAVLYRLDHGQVDKVRTFSEECELDAGGLPVIWLNGVSPSQSVAVLATIVQAEKKPESGALAAIAMTDDPSAESALESFTQPRQPQALRERTVFWLGSERGHAGFEALQRLGRQDASDALRDKVAFAFNVSHDPGAVDELIRMAKTDAAPHVREQALFWLAQKAGAKAGSALSAAVNDDPDTAVKERAVFGLSQLPKDQGVPLLIHVAETNSNPTVRKRAMFWLGQSNDPRALAFFQQVLSK